MLLLVACLIPPVHAENAPFNIKVWPCKLELEGRPGGTREFKINAQNLGTQDQELRIYFNDYYIRRDNQFVFKEPGYYSYSCSKWLTSNQNTVKVAVGRTAQASFTLAVPEGAEPGGHYAIIFFQQVTQKTKTPVKTVPRIGVVTLVTVPGEIVRKVDVRSVSVSSSWFWPPRGIMRLPRKKAFARAVIYNSGNVHTTVRGKVTYTPTFGWGAGSVDLPEITILPKTTRHLQAELPNPPVLGSYDARFKIEYGPAIDVYDTTIEGKTSFRSYPFGLLVAALVVVALVAGAVLLVIYLARCRRRKKAGAEAAAEETAVEAEVEAVVGGPPEETGRDPAAGARSEEQEAAPRKKRGQQPPEDGGDDFSRMETLKLPFDDL